MTDVANVADMPKYHLGAHGAEALLGPVQTTLRELETRVAHYRERLRLTAADDAALVEAHAALAAARETVERVYAGSVQTARGEATR